jgi:hypothetical protein
MFLNPLQLPGVLLHPELLSECPILLKKLHPEWTKIQGADQIEALKKKVPA